MRSAPCFALLASGLLLLTSACGGDDAGSGGASGTTSGTGGGPQGVPCDGAPADLSLGGTWAATARLEVTLQGVPGGAITICPEGQIGESFLVLLVTMQQGGPGALSEVQATLCSIDLPVVTALVGTCDPASQALVSSQIITPDALIAALPGVASTPVTGTIDGDAVSFERFQVVIGSTAPPGSAQPAWDTVSPACNATTVGRTSQCETTCVSDCAGLRDDDADGFPGVTVNVCGTTPADTQNGALCHPETPNDPGATLQGRGFIDMLVDPQLGGTAVSSCEVTGTVDSGVGYNLVGGDIYLAGAPISVTSAIKSLPSFQVDPANSRFRLVRIDGQYGAPDFAVDPANPAAACATILSRVNEL